MSIILLLKPIIDWFTKPKLSDVELYVMNKNPQNAAEVDYWVRHFEFNRLNRRSILG
jgi:hypothetical protein